MANGQHLQHLLRGARSWNAWRRAHPEIQINLSNAALGGMDLTKYNLARADLTKATIRFANLTGTALTEAQLNDAFLYGAILREADLTKAHLIDAELREVVLVKAKLIKARLWGVDFHRADLSEAQLNEAQLHEADLTNATLTNTSFRKAKLHHALLKYSQLKGTDFTKATIGFTIFGDLDLRGAKGLETLVHQGPSTIGVDTLLRSEGQVPEIFLRKAGLSENFIEYAFALVQSPIRYYTCFISYTHQDEGFTKRLYADLQSEGVRCWFAPEDLKIGDHYHQRIDESIRLYDKLILILSEQAVQSAWVEREVVAAREKEDREQRPVLFPLRLDDAVMETTKAWAADVRRRWHIGDFTQWKHHDTYQQALERLLRDLKAEHKPAI